jgi:hypothetical protein
LKNPATVEKPCNEMTVKAFSGHSDHPLRTPGRMKGWSPERENSREKWKDQDV